MFIYPMLSNFVNIFCLLFPTPDSGVHVKFKWFRQNIKFSTLGHINVKSFGSHEAKNVGKTLLTKALVVCLSETRADNELVWWCPSRQRIHHPQ